MREPLRRRASLDRLEQSEMWRQPRRDLSGRQWRCGRIEIVPSHHLKASAGAFQILSHGLQEFGFRWRRPDQGVDHDHHQGRSQYAVEGVRRSPSNLSRFKNRDIHGGDRPYGYQTENQKQLGNGRQQVTDRSEYYKQEGHDEAGVVQQLAGYRHDSRLHRRCGENGQASLEQAERDSGLTDSKGEERAERSQDLQRGCNPGRQRRLEGRSRGFDPPPVSRSQLFYEKGDQRHGRYWPRTVTTAVCPIRYG